MENISHVLLATDGSQGSLDAAKLAGILVGSAGITISIVTVHDEDALLLPAMMGAVLPSSATYTPFPKKKMQELIEKSAEEDILGPTADALRAVGAKVEKIHLWGNAVQQICTYADDTHVDLIVIGRRGKSLFEKLLLGSVSSQVVNHAPCSVLVAG